MKKIMFFALLSLVFSCEKSEEIGQDENSNLYARCGSANGINNYTTCKSNSNVANVIGNTSWAYGNNGVGFIDYELEQNFNATFEFGPIGRVMPPDQIVTGNVDFMEAAHYNPINIGNMYPHHYLKDNNELTEQIAEDLKKHFVCVIRQYVLDNYPTNSIIRGIDFYGDTLACNDEGVPWETRYLRADITIYLYD